jgi:hypothetical protein
VGWKELEGLKFCSPELGLLFGVDGLEVLKGFFLGAFSFELFSKLLRKSLICLLGLKLLPKFAILSCFFFSKSFSHSSFA